MEHRFLAYTMLLHAHVVCSLAMAMEWVQVWENDITHLEVLCQTAILFQSRHEQKRKLFLLQGQHHHTCPVVFRIQNGPAVEDIHVTASKSFWQVYIHRLLPSEMLCALVADLVFLSAGPQLACITCPQLGANTASKSHM